MSSIRAVSITLIFTCSYLFFYLVLFICQLDLEGQLSSHESASDSSSVEDHVQDSRSMISTQVHTMPVKVIPHICIAHPFCA